MSLKDPKHVEDTDVLDEVSEDETYENNLIVFNDDHNSFQHVIETLIEVCKHTFEQAEQCTTLIHYKGKCSVKNGPFEELVDMKRSINERGIDAKVY